MSRIDTIPQEATDLAVHVALCAQRHTETVKRLDDAKEAIGATRDAIGATRDAVASLRRDVQRIGALVVLLVGAVQGIPFAPAALQAVARIFGG